MKEKGRILGVDDGPFSRSKDKYAPFTAVLMRLDGRIEGIRIGTLPVDGTSAEDKVIEMAKSIGLDNIDVMMSEGVTFAGFDIVSPWEIYDKTGIPYVSVTRSEADIPAMEAALSKYGEFDKIQKLNSLKPVKCIINDLEFVVNFAGLDEKDALIILKKSLLVGNVPEPVRIAHMISDAIYNSKIH